VAATVRSLLPAPELCVKATVQCQNEASLPRSVREAPARTTRARKRKVSTEPPGSARFDMAAIIRMRLTQST